jgi:hypothetical protein
VGESPPMSTLLACEDCVGTSDSDGPLFGGYADTSGESLKVPMVDFPLGTDRDELVFGCPAEDGSLLGATLLKDFEQTPMSSQFTSVAALPLEEVQAEIVWNSAPVMGLLKQGFLGPRSPSPAPSSLGCKTIPVNGSVSSPTSEVSGLLFSLSSTHVHVAIGVFLEGEGEGHQTAA